MKRTKKFLGVTLALALTAGVSVPAFAVDGEMTVTPDLEGYFDPSIVDVTLPTTNLTFTIDPQGLAYAASQSAYRGDTADITEGATVLFANGATSTTAPKENPNYSASETDPAEAAYGQYLKSDGTGTNDPDEAEQVTSVTGATGYSNKSDPMTASNNGFGDLTLSIKATVSNVGGAGQAVMSAEENMDEAESPSLFMKLTDTKNNTKVLAKGDVEITKSLEGHDINDYTIAWDATAGEYTKTLKTTAAHSKETTFYLVGAASQNDTWGSVSTFPTIKVVWTATAGVSSVKVPTVAVGGMVTINSGEYSNTDTYSVQITGANSVTGVGFKKNASDTSTTAYTGNASSGWGQNGTTFVTANGNVVTVTADYLNNMNSNLKGDRYLVITTDAGTATIYVKYTT